MLVPNTPSSRLPSVFITGQLRLPSVFTTGESRLPDVFTTGESRLPGVFTTGESSLLSVFVTGSRFGHLGSFYLFKEHTTIFEVNVVLKIDCRLL
jgi:hypothetical protein